MRAVIQRVLEASVKVDGKVIGSCQKGYMILFCAMENDTLEDISLLAKKVALLRVFEDEDEKMNKSILDVGGSVLSISQFSLYGDTRKGNRPSYIKSLNKEEASVLYDVFNEELKKHVSVETGIFHAEMEVHIINDGPMTIEIRKENEYEK